jgi:threonine/homoserine/homoserine lactone efflux protein
VPSPEILIVFLGAVLLLAVTPGPDLLYITARSAGEGRAAGVASVLGISVGIVGHTAAVSLGLSSLLRAVPLAFEILRWAGAAYLVILGLQLLLRPRYESGRRSTDPASMRVVFLQGLLTNILNPKVALFFVAFLPQFVDPSAGRVGLQLFLLGCLFNILGSCVNLAAALLASRVNTWLQTPTGSPSLLHRISGGVLVALGARLALSSNR